MADENVTTKFKVDISDLRKNISDADRLVREYRAELQNASAGMKKGEESADSLSRKIEAQSRIVEAEEKKLQALKEELQRYQERIQQGQTIVDDLTERHRQAAQAFGQDSEEARKLAEQLKKAQEAQERNVTAADKLRVSIVNQDTAVKNAHGQVQQFTDQLGKLQSNEKEVKDKTDAMNDAFKNATDNGLNAFTVALGDLVADVIEQAVEGLKNLALSVVDVGRTFDSSLSKVKAISGASAEETEQLKTMAEELGRTTKFTAAQVADGMSYMAMAGWKTEDILSNIAPVLELATASGEELALTSDIVTDALTAFGLKSEDTQYFVDTLAQTAANANTNVALMGETFKYCAPLAGALGYSLDDMSWAIGLMASQGIKASQAGTSMRRMLSDLTGEITISGKETGDMIVQTENADGSMRDLYGIVNDLRFAFSQLTEAERVNQAKALVGQNAMSGFLALMNASEEEAQKMRSSLDESTGAAEKMAATMQDNLGGKMVELDSAMDGFKKKVYEGMVDPLTDLVVLVTERVVPELNELADDFAAWMADFEEENGTVKENVEAFLDKAIPAVKEFLQWVKDNGPEIEATIAGIVTAIAAFKAVTVIQSAVTAFQALAAVIELVGVKQAALNLIMNANPIALVISAVAGLIAAMITLYNTNEDFRNFCDGMWEEIDKTMQEYYQDWELGAQDISDWFQEFSDDWKQGASDIAEGWKTFWADWKRGWDEIKENWTGFWDNWKLGLGVIRDAINGIIRLLNKIPGVDIPEIGSVPQMARGGIVNRPTLAQIGEAGAEAVIPLENNTQGLRELANLLRQEMDGGGGTGGTVQFTQNISSPKPLSEYEIWRQTRNLLDIVKKKK